MEGQKVQSKLTILVRPMCGEALLRYAVQAEDTELEDLPEVMRTEEAAFFIPAQEAKRQL